MKIKLLIISLILAIPLLAQDEYFDIIKYSVNGIEIPQFQPETNANAYISFIKQEKNTLFAIGNGRDTTYSYGMIEKINEYDITPTDTANLVVFTAYKWYYANTYDKKEGIAEITSYRIFYNRQMILQVLIKVEDEDKLNEFYITAYNIHYKEN